MSEEYFSQPRELISEDLEGVLPDDEDEQSLQQPHFVVVVFAAPERDHSIMGHLVGIEFSDCLKVDIRASLDSSFKFISEVLVSKENRLLSSVILNLGPEVTNLPGPFYMSNTKIVDIDPVAKTCIMAVDLIKANLEQS